MHGVVKSQTWLCDWTELKKKVSSQPWREVEEPKCKLLSEETQFEKAKYCVIPTVWHSGQAKIMETVKTSADGSGLGKGKG